jgi:hypothetical protein
MEQGATSTLHRPNTTPATLTAQMPSSTAADTSEAWSTVTDNPARTPAGLQLPACQKCRLRKVRCDRSSPKCSNCVRSKAACIIVDPETGEQYARDYLRQLEEEEATLKARLGDRAIPSYDPPPVLSFESVAQTVGPPTVGSTASHSYYVGDGSGLGFLHNILSDPRWQEHRVRIMHQLAARPRIQKSHVQPNPLPSPPEAEALLNNYFTRFHIHHTFLLRHEVLSIFNRLYSPLVDNPVTIQDRFRLFMVFAISATTRHRAGLSPENPYGYFKAAEGYLGSIPLIKDLDAVQNLLLIARFGMYHHVTSLWEISQVCMRQCIEWRLHMPRLSPLNLLSEQHRRRIFWECYILDRYSSGILGRPFAISEDDISIGLPIDADDEALMTSTAPTLDDMPQNTSSRPTELSIFIHCIKLRQISSRIHTRFYTGTGSGSHLNSMAKRGRSSGHISIGHVYTYFSRFQMELKAWRLTAPIYPSPRSLYERPEWHDFLYEKDLMLLARGALHNIPPRSLIATGVFKEVFTACYVSARQVIELYANLMAKRAITWTRSYFQVIFTAGLTLIYCSNLDVVKVNAKDSDIQQSLDTCERILQFFKEKMPDAGSFTLAFELLKTECLKNPILSDEELRHTGSSIPYESLDQGPTSSTSGLSNVNMGPLTNPLAIPDMLYNPSVDLQLYDLNMGEPDFGITDNLSLMTQLEAGLGEYAWGWIPMDDNFSNQLSL